jgi:superfamily II DNA or RNA helicase
LTLDRDSLLGRTVRHQSQPNAVFIITAVSYEVGVGDVAFLRRISPLPVSEIGTVAINQLEDTSIEDLVWHRDGLTFLVAKALRGALESEESILAARTIFKEYQFRPLIKYLESSNKRILIADEVGLGKTIEAGYILVEELARAKMSRILILCPAGLMKKWRDELRYRFGIEFGLTSGRFLQEMLSSQKSFRSIASFDSFRGKANLALSNIQPLDMLIIDEAHHMIGRKGDILRRELGLCLSRQSRRVIGLSATPIQIDRQDLRRVLEVILGGRIDSERFTRDIELASALNRVVELSRTAPSPQAQKQIRSSMTVLSRLGAKNLPELDEVVSHLEDSSRSRVQYVNALTNQLEQLNPFRDTLIRSRRRDVGELRTRVVFNHPVQLQTRFEIGYQHGEEVATSEQSMYDEVDGLLKESFTHVHRLQLSSCLHAMIDLLRIGMRGFSVWRREERFLTSLDLEDVDNPNEYEPYHRTLSQEEMESCQRLVDKYGLLSADSKWDKLISILAEIKNHRESRKVILFTQWVPTLRYLGKRSHQIDGYVTYAISGEESPWHIQETLDAFRKAQGSALLLTTDFLSEGRDLQHASVIINFDFPYNPQRVEQRIGRVDRVGQERKTIEIHNVWVKGSLDEQILTILQNRLDVFREALGDVNNFLTIETREDGSLVDAYREESRLAARRQLDDFGVFGVEDYLDKEIRALRMKRFGSLTRFIWLIVAQALVLASGGVARIEKSRESVRVGPILANDIETVARWALADAHFVRLEIESNMNQEGFVQIAKLPRAQGLFVPSSHPLARLSANVVFNSFASYGKKEETIVLSNRVDMTPCRRRIILCRYFLESEHMRAHKLSYWIDDGGVGVRQLIDKELDDFQDWLEQASLVCISTRKWRPSETVSQVVSRDFANWIERQIRAVRVAVDDENREMEASRKSISYLAEVNLRN